MGIFDNLEQLTADGGCTVRALERVIKAPFGYPGAKSRSIKQLIPLLPYGEVYVEPFGGSAAVLLARASSKLEVYNDRYGGVTDFYRCVRDDRLCALLIDWLNHTVHSREEWEHCKATWDTEKDLVERAAKWYYMTVYSFGCLGRNFGRQTGTNGSKTMGRNTTSGKARSKLSEFNRINERLRNVMIENRDAVTMLKEFDGPTSVFYLDPPYLDVHKGTYKHEMTPEEHRVLLDTIQGLQGFVALSGYGNDLYNEYDWDDIYVWDQATSIKAMAFTETNHKKCYDQIAGREKATEYLWIKEFNDG